MLTYIKLILNSLSNFVKLSANKQLVYFMLLLIIASSAIIFKFYNQYNATTIQDKANLKECQEEVVILNQQIYSIKEAYLLKDLKRSDSLLKASTELRNSIKPMVNKLNKKINEVHN